MQVSPFSRSRAMLAAIAAAFTGGANMTEFLSSLGEYTSRGHGGKHRSFATSFGGNTVGKGIYNPHQGKQECARRVDQRMVCEIRITYK